jgi:hypothetical protein
MFPAARKGDPVTHDMLVPSGVIGPPVTGSCPGMGMVMIENLPAAHVMCTVVCSGATSLGPVHPPLPIPPAPPPVIVTGAAAVLIHNMPAARWAPSGDVAACGVFLGDLKLAVTRTVLIGNAASPNVASISCAAAWARVNDDVQRVLMKGGDADPLERNRHISKAYAEMYQRQPQLRWIGLASIVSRQAGCAMEKAKDKSGSWIPWVSDPAGTAFNALADTNKTIFSDIYPAMRFYELYGMAGVERCGKANGNRIPSEILKALWLLDKGRKLLADDPDNGRGKAYLRYAADKIAEYEQAGIVEEQIYTNEEYKEAFEDNEWWAKRRLGRWFGATRPQLPLSSRCDGDTPVPFNGSIINKDDRVSYYHRLMLKFENETEEWRQAVLNDIISQAT